MFIHTKIGELLKDVTLKYFSKMVPDVNSVHSTVITSKKLICPVNELAVDRENIQARIECATYMIF